MSLSIALSRGVTLGRTLDLLQAAGLDVSAVRGERRQGVIALPGGALALVTTAHDVPVYVESGAAAVGVVGKEVLLERRGSVHELLDLRLGRSRLVYAAPAARPAGRGTDRRLRVATKYPLTARRYFASSGRQVLIVDLHGPVDTAPRLGIADGVVDLVRSGRTLAAAGLEVREEIAVCSQRLIAGRAARALFAAEIDDLLKALRAAVAAAGEQPGAVAGS